MCARGGGIKIKLLQILTSLQVRHKLVQTSQHILLKIHLEEYTYVCVYSPVQ